MNKTLTILWVIIITGTILIGIKFTKPETSIELHNEPLDEITTTNPDSNKTSVTKIENLDLQNTNPNELTKTYSEYLSLGDSQFESLEFTSAIENYTNASKLNPTSTEALIKLGNSYLKNNDPSKAEAAFLKAEEVDPTSIEAKIGVARSYVNRRNVEKAKNIIWQLNVDEPIVKYYTGILLILYKDFEGSKNQFQQLITLNENIINSNKGIANEAEKFPLLNPILIENSQTFLDAFETFSYFKEGEEIHLQALLAKALTNVGEYEASIPLLFDIINKKSNYRDAWIILGYAYLNTNKTLDAIDALTQAKALNEEKPETLFLLGLAYFANNEIDKAILYLEEAEKFGYEPKDQLNLKLGDLYLLKEEYKKSAEKYEAVLEVNTSNMGVFIRTVWLNIDKLENPQKALKFAYLALETNPEEAMSFNLVGWALTAKENYEEAKKYLATALEINPQFDAATLNLGWFYEKQGLTTLAKEYYKRAYTLGNGNSIAALSAIRFNNLLEQETKPDYYKANISAP